MHVERKRTFTMQQWMSSAIFVEYFHIHSHTKHTHWKLAAAAIAQLKYTIDFNLICLYFTCASWTNFINIFNKHIYSVSIYQIVHPSILFNRTIFTLIISQCEYKFNGIYVNIIFNGKWFHFQCFPFSDTLYSVI